MSNNAADAETRAAVIAKWANSGLPAKVPGGIRSGRLKPTIIANTPQQNTPYATVDSKASQGPTLNTPGGPGSAYVDYRETEIVVRGVGESAICALMGQIHNSFDEQLLPLNAQNPTVTWLRTELMPDMLEQEPTTKGGEDIWKGTVKYKVWSNRIQ